MITPSALRSMTSNSSTASTEPSFTRFRLVMGLRRAVTPNGWRWIVDAHKGDGRRYIVHSGELIAAFLELERVTHTVEVQSD
jgi:hypothetical protein